MKRANEKTSLLKGALRSRYGGNEITDQKKIISEGMKPSKALFRSIFGKTFLFLTTHFNNERASDLIQTQGIDDAMTQLLQEGKELPTKEDLLPYLTKELDSMKLNTTLLTEAGFKMNEGQYYLAIAEAMKKMIDEKLEATAKLTCTKSLE